MKYKYLLIGDNKGSSIVSKENGDLALSGLYLWSRAFEESGEKGDIEPFWRKDDLEEYDIVHINYTPSNMQLPTVIRDELGKNSSTKLVINVDLDVSHWGVNWAYNITTMVKELKEADILFHVEPKGAEMLQHLLDKEVHCLAHPVDVSTLYDYIKKEREPMISTIFHRYTADSLIPYIAQRNIPIRRVLFGYTPINKTGCVANAGMYDQIIMLQGFKQHIEEISKSAIACDMYSGYTFGRSVVEMAALCIPTVCSNTIQAGTLLFPELTVSPFDTKGAQERFERLLSDEEFADKAIKLAHDGCRFYSLKNSYERFVRMIEY